MPTNPQHPNREKTDGVVLIQIDGLSRFQFERALRSGRMPHLRKLLNGNYSRLLSFYPGQPSCTPAVQAELHYGVRCATPAFSFYDRETRQNVRMYDSEWAKRIAEESANQGSGLLEGGSSYANIYTGGAKKAKYCGELNTFSHWSTELSVSRLLRLAARNPKATLRLLKLLGIEMGIGLYDAIRGITSRGDFAAELSFVPARLAVAISLREAIRSEVIDDIKAGLPVIHANFFGYDEAAHRRGPHSGFAHWTLKGLDQSIRAICKAANRSKNKTYRIVVFSDHGQEYTTPYSEIANRSIADAISALLPNGFRLSPNSSIEAFMERSKSILNDSHTPESPEQSSEREVHLQAMGPVAHLYVDGYLDTNQRLSWARLFCTEAQIPIALFTDSNGEIKCLTATETGDLNILRRQLIERGHEFVEETLEDLSLLVHSKYAGDLVMLGWHSGGKPLTFADERGAHAGPGAQECRGFVMLPEALEWDRPSMRPSDLRGIVETALGRKPTVAFTTDNTASQHTFSESLRIVSYNVHGGVGTDRRIDSDRMTKAVRQMKADVICFQEAYESDTGRSLRESLQTAFESEVHYSFLPLHERNGIKFGLALASKYPIKIRKSEPFGLNDDRFALREPRGSIWAQVSPPNCPPLNIVNTHFGLNSRERIHQAQCLLGEEWLGSLEKEALVVICGDFNAGPRGSAYLAFAQVLSDTQLTANHGQAKASFVSWAPLRRIDHIFTSSKLEVPASGVLRSPSIRKASDHLPVYADMKIA